VCACWNSIKLAFYDYIFQGRIALHVVNGWLTRNVETLSFQETDRPGTNAMIFKKFSPKNLAKKMAILTQKKAK
jgi:hypothetical protein